VFKLGDVGFGDKVRIEQAEVTITSGHAGHVGSCFGVTTPSATGVDVMGDPADDVASMCTSRKRMLLMLGSHPRWSLSSNTQRAREPSSAVKPS
jgi:hypothetical protein